jgi:hypothetical protein
MALYAPEAVFIANDGRTITDRTEIAAQFQRNRPTFRGKVAALA